MIKALHNCEGLLFLEPFFPFDYLNFKFNETTSELNPLLLE